MNCLQHCLVGALHALFSIVFLDFLPNLRPDRTTDLQSKLFDTMKLYFGNQFTILEHVESGGTQWLSGRVLDSTPRGRGFDPHRRHCVVSLSKNINHSLVLVQPRKTRPYLTERLLIGRKESNQAI